MVAAQVTSNKLTEDSVLVQDLCGRMVAYIQLTTCHNFFKHSYSSIILLMLFTTHYHLKATTGFHGLNCEMLVKGLNL